MTKYFTFFLIILINILSHAGINNFETNNASSGLIFWATSLPDSGELDLVDPFTFAEQCRIDVRPLLVVQTTSYPGGLFQKFDRFGYYSMRSRKLNTDCGDRYFRYELEGNYSDSFSKVKDLRALTRLGKKVPCPSKLCNDGTDEVTSNIYMIENREGGEVTDIHIFDDGFIAFRAFYRHETAENSQVRGGVFSFNPKDPNGLKKVLKEKFSYPLYDKAKKEISDKREHSRTRYPEDDFVFEGTVNPEAMQIIDQLN